MPPKRKPGASTAKDKGKQPAKSRSKLARENDISADEETEIREAFHLFAISGAEGFEDEKEGVLPTKDVRRAMIALSLPPESPEELASFLEVLDPDSEGFVTFTPFLQICALKLRNRSDESVSIELEAAYKLFTRGSRGPITIAHLKRVARELKEGVSDDMLQSMILEANGGAGVSKGVGLDDFESIMRRAGVF